MTGVQTCALPILQKAHFGLRMQKATQQLSNLSLLPTSRRAIARAKTILVEKQRATKSEAAPGVASK